MVTLTLNGAPAPTSYALGSVYTLLALVDAQEPLSVEWSVARQGEPPIAGTGPIRFEPVAAETHYLHVAAVGQDGVLQQTVFQLQVVAAGASAMSPTIQWSTTSPAIRQTVVATISAANPSTGSRRPPRNIAWTVYLNGTPILGGEGAQTGFPILYPGVYRLVATLVDEGGNSATADSSIVVPGGFELQTAVVPKQPTGTLYYLGSVYSATVEGYAQLATELPYLVISANSAVHLLPGTTHVIAEVEEGGVVQDEVVLRSRLGNWSLVGGPGGLTTESLFYDYVPAVPLPAPHDRLFRYTLDQWKVGGTSVSDYRFRVRFKCYREGQKLYEYSACPYANYPGGEALREKRMVALITNVDFRLDAESPDNRLGSTDTITYTTPNQITLEGNFTPDGAPYGVAYREEDHGFTAQNIIANYEAAGHPDIKTHAVYGIPGVRPALLDFTQPGLPRIIQYAKRLHGKLVVYMAGGGVSYDTVIWARIYTGKSPGYQVVRLRCADVLYNGSLERYVKVAEADIDLSDFEFGKVGLAIDLTLDEAEAHTTPYYRTEDTDDAWETEEGGFFWQVEESGTDVNYQPPEIAPERVYATSGSQAVHYEGACYYRPVPVAVFDGTHAVAGTVIESCADPVCGDRGVYCYTDGTNFAQVIQPLDHPAPYLAFASDQAHCWYDPYFVAIAGDGTVAINEPYLPYSGTSGCGIGYAYASCGSLAAIAVIYPAAASPHSFVAYGSNCYALSGSVADLRPYETVALVADVTAVASCDDVACTGSDASGDSAWYLDQHGQRVQVYFPHLNQGIPSYGAAQERMSPGYGRTPPGRLYYNSWAQPIWPIMTAQEAATVDFVMTPLGWTRKLYVRRGTTVTEYSYGLGTVRKRIDLQAGDHVFLQFGSRSTNLEGYVDYAKRVTLPAYYDSAVLDTGTASSIRALGFCGFSQVEDYVFFGTLPVETAMSLPNPDSIVTVTGSGAEEQLLVRTFAYGDRYYPLSWPAYGGEVLNMPVTFKFYAGRNIAGRHGEMDVWLDLDQSLPGFLKVSRYHVLTADAGQYRVTAQIGDINRRGLRVSSSTEANELLLPRVYATTEGQTIVVVGGGTEIYHDGNVYAVVGTDTGISTQVYTAQSVFSGGAWTTADGSAWLTSGTLPWLS